MDKLAQLRRVKLLALSLLLIAAAIFTTTLFLPPARWGPAAVYRPPHRDHSPQQDAHCR